MAQADELRRAMGKKLVDEMEAKRIAFVEGCVHHKIPAPKAEKPAKGKVGTVVVVAVDRRTPKGAVKELEREAARMNAAAAKKGGKAPKPEKPKRLSCLDAASGRRRWSRPLAALRGAAPRFAVPLSGGRAALGLGGAALAVDLGTGDSVSLREHYRGKVTLVNIWATWCVPCRVEMPAMERVYTQLAPRGFSIAAVSIDEGPPDDVRAFGQELKLTFDLLQDRSGRIQQSYQTTGVPESFLLDRHGVIVKRIIGAHDWNSPANRALVERLLDEPGT